MHSCIARPYQWVAHARGLAICYHVACPNLAFSLASNAKIYPGSKAGRSGVASVRGMVR
jgi:hypothetical protein